jgi:hypothetical protein
MAFVPPDFEVPELLETDRFRIRSLTIHDLVKDYDAVMTSREYLWEQFGQAWGWPRDDLTLEQDLIDLASHQKEAQRRSSFAYAVMRPDELVQLGCVYIAPPTSKALTPRPPCGSGPARWPATWTRCCMRPCGAGLRIAGRLLGLPGLAGSCHGISTTRCPTSDREAEHAGRANKRSEPLSSVDGAPGAPSDARSTATAVGVWPRTPRLGA